MADQTVEPTILKVTNITVRFGGLAAVDDVSFEVEKGQIVGVIGPNGAGKSTAFNAITGFARLASGTIEFDGSRIDNLPVEEICHRGIGRTFQLVRLFPSLTVLENVMVATSLTTPNLRIAKEAAEQIIEKVGLQNRIHDLVSMVPLADQKHTEIARALGSRPKLLLLDEMISGLTHTETDELLELITQLNETGLSFIIVEHVLRVIREVCHETLVFDHGKLIAKGTPSDVMTDPQVIEAYIGKKAAHKGVV